MAFYNVIDYGDVCEFVCEDEAIRNAVYSLIQKASEHADDKKKSVLERVLKRNIGKEANGYCCRDVDAYIDEINYIKIYTTYCARHI